MPNQKIAELIAAKLKDGLVHPGDGGEVPPTAIPLPMFRNAGMPKEYVDLQNATAKLIGEAIVHVIETEGRVIVSAAELEDLRWRAAASEPLDENIAPGNLAVHCRSCDRNHQNPLTWLAVRGGPVVEVDGRQLLKGLSNREIDCPHKSREKK